MKGWNNLGTGGKVASICLICVVIAALGYGVWQSGRPPAGATMQTAAVPGAAPATAAGQPPASATGTATAAAPDAAAPEAASGPSFDVVRVAPDGSALVAGRAEAGSKVEIKIGAATAAQATADAQGRFVAQFTLPASAEPRVLSLSETASDGRVSAGQANVIVAPSSAEAVAAAAAADASAASGQAAPAGTAADAAAAATGQSATQAPAVLMAGQAGVKVLQPSAASASAPMAIDTIAYSTAGEVELSGHGTPGETLRIYLDNHLAQQVAVDQKGGWTLRLPDIASGVYTLRADQVDSTGKVTARFETPFKREAPEALAEAGGAAAGVKAAIVTVQPGYTLWGIARASYGRGTLYVRVYDANRDQIRNPDLIYPGQVFSVPGAP
ncbi:LysM peptidoglycan-binding domain-containing protein [Thioclava sp. BHET1]|nr:LysM peptidoglycan-binding domain-containing protein [Thioclava sp. BHET1]